MSMTLDDWAKFAKECMEHKYKVEGTGEPVVTAKQVQYGCTCTECNEIYPHAEVRDNFVCYSCKSYKMMFE